MKTHTRLALMAGLAAVASIATAEDQPSVEIALYPGIRVTSKSGRRT